MIYKPSLLLIVVLAVFVLGLSMVFNTSAAEVLDRSLPQSPYHALVKQLAYAFVAFLLALFIRFYLGYNQLLEGSGRFLFIGTLLLIAVFIPGIGRQVNGAHRWLGISGYSFQPSEFIKLLIPLHYIQTITTTSHPLSFRKFLYLLGKLAIPLVLILIEPDNGTIAIILSSLIVLFMLTKVKCIYWLPPICIFLSAGVGFALKLPYVMDRIKVYLNPTLDLQGTGHQSYQSKIALGSGGVFGKGLGESLQKLDYLPEARTDFIAAIFGEEFGFIGIFILILLFMVIGYLGFSISVESSNLRALYTSAIFTYLICIQAFLNLGVVSGLLPSKGTNLPFFSQGGSSLLANFIMICVLMDIGKRKQNEIL